MLTNRQFVLTYFIYSNWLTFTLSCLYCVLVSLVDLPRLVNYEKELHSFSNSSSRDRASDSGREPNANMT